MMKIKKKEKKRTYVVVGKGAREHSIVWKLRMSKNTGQIICAPGNIGTEEIAENTMFDANNVGGLSSALHHFNNLSKDKIDAVIIGPEDPLALGVVDRLQELGIPTFGPTKNAAMLEASKVFMKLFCQRHGIPTAEFIICRGTEDVRKKLKKFARERGGYPVVVKISDLAEGKGAVVCKSRKQVFAFLKRIDRGEFKNYNGEIILEECLKGVEASFIVMVDINDHIKKLATALDYKRAYNNNHGLNTGGMGCVSPNPFVTKAIERKIMNKIVIPIVQGMKEEDNPYSGFLYAGVMIVDGEPYLLEINARLGDPEAEVILPRMKSDFGELIITAIKGNLDKKRIHWDTQSCVTIVHASKRYPRKDYKKGFVVEGLEKVKAMGAILFIAGLKKREDGKLVTDGGRNFMISAKGKNVAAARELAYAASAKIKCKNLFYRKDIAE